MCAHAVKEKYPGPSKPVQIHQNRISTRGTIIYRKPRSSQLLQYHEEKEM